MGRWPLLFAPLWAACLQPAPLEWPIDDHGQLIVSVLTRSDGVTIEAGPWMGLPTLDFAAVGNESVWWLAEFPGDLASSQLRPPALVAALAVTPTAGRTLDQYPELGAPMVWRSAAAPGPFQLDAPGLPEVFRSVWIRDAACPTFEARLARIPEPLKLILPWDGESALGVTVLGTHYRLTPGGVRRLAIEGWPGGAVAAGGRGPGTDLAVALVDGRLLRGQLTAEGVRYEPPREVFGPSPSLESARALAFSPDGSRILLAGGDGHLVLADTATSSVVADVIPDPQESADHHRLAWAGPGEVLGLFRAPSLRAFGVWRLRLDPRPRLEVEAFGIDTFDVPNELALIEGQWAIAGSGVDQLLEPQKLYFRGERRWAPELAFPVNQRVESLVPLSASAGFAYGTREGARIGVQPRLRSGRRCQALPFRDQTPQGGDVIALVPLSDGRILAQLENLDQLLVLRPHQTWPTR